LTITVVIDCIRARLDSSRIYLTVVIVAIAVVANEAGRLGASHSACCCVAVSIAVGISIVCVTNAFIDLTIAVVIGSVANFRCTGIDCIVVIITVVTVANIT
jgi:hypothetical protein